MWYKIYADGTEMDLVHASSPREAVEIVKLRNSGLDFTGVHWTYKGI